MARAAFFRLTLPVILCGCIYQTLTAPIPPPVDDDGAHPYLVPGPDSIPTPDAVPTDEAEDVDIIDDLSRTASWLQDPKLLDGLRKLLDIIDSHTERMRDGGCGGCGGGGRVNTAANNTANALTGGGVEEEEEGIEYTNPNCDPDPLDLLQGLPPRPRPQPPQNEVQVSSDDRGSIHITCKGISVCNPVTVVHSKDGKSISLDALGSSDGRSWWRGRRRKKKKEKDRGKVGGSRWRSALRKWKWWFSSFEDESWDE
ncbi:hypothetical protein VTJ49DRAFT_7254 [Mycothermus thermophilus]|uniref:Uncharacterized protein n=1 Tax=Humicola insolens TaxID=85995 RepID=A0ABR3VHR1_HUMIN